MLIKILKTILRPVKRFFLLPSFRFSDHFRRFQEVFAFSPKEEMLSAAMEFVKDSKIEGDYLEFGVWRGNSFTKAFHSAQWKKLKSMRFYAFDSFKGLPELRGIDLDGPCRFTKGQYAYDVDKFKINISKKGVELDKIEIIPGWYDEVLNEDTKKRLPIRKAAVIWIDCDLYESTVPVLNFITDYLQDGTILVFHDWFSFKGDPDKGEQKAFREWLKRNPSIKATKFYKFSWLGESFIIHIKNPT